MEIYFLHATSENTQATAEPAWHRGGGNSTQAAGAGLTWGLIMNVNRLIFRLWATLSLVYLQLWTESDLRWTQQHNAGDTDDMTSQGSVVGIDGGEIIPNRSSGTCILRCIYTISPLYDGCSVGSLCTDGGISTVYAIKVASCGRGLRFTSPPMHAQRLKHALMPIRSYSVILPMVSNKSTRSTDDI